MKMNVATFAFVVGFLISTTQLSAQEKPVSVGFKAGTSLSNYRLGGDLKGLKSKLNIGGSAGGFVKFNLSQNFALQSGVDVYYRTTELESVNNKTTGKIKSLGVEVPVYGIVQGALGSGKAFVGAGPYVGYGISTKYDGVNLFKKNTGTDKPNLNRFDYGVGGIIGYDFGQNWQLHATYQLGLADLQKGNKSSMKNQGIAIGLAYKF